MALVPGWCSVQPRRNLCALLAVLGPAAAALVSYTLTAAPTVHWSDTAELQRAAYTLELTHPPGYPLYSILGRLWTALLPIGDVAYRMNLFSAVTAAVAVAFVAWLVWRLTGRALAAATAGLALGLAPSFWSQAIVAEVYALHCLLVAALLVAVLNDKPRLWLVALLLGLGITHHRMALLMLPGVAIGLAFLVRPSALSRRRIGAAVALFLVGASPLCLTWLQGDWGSLTEFWAHVAHTGEEWLSLGKLPQHLATEVLPLATQQLGLFGLALAAVGAAWGLASTVPTLRAGVLAIGASLILGFAFLTVYRVPDAFAFLPHVQVLESVLIGLGIGGLQAWVAPKSGPSAGRLITIAAGVALAGIFIVQGREAWSANHRTQGDWLYPRSRSTEVMEDVPRGGVLVADWLLGQTMLYLQSVEGLRTDLKIVICLERDASAAVALLDEGVAVYLWGTAWTEQFPDGDGHELVAAERGPYQEGLYRLTTASVLDARPWHSLPVAEAAPGATALLSAAVRPWPLEAGQLAQLRVCWASAPRTKREAAVTLRLDREHEWFSRPVALAEKGVDGCEAGKLVLPSPAFSSRVTAELLLQSEDESTTALLVPQKWLVVPDPAAPLAEEGWDDVGALQAAANREIAGAQLAEMRHTGSTQPGVGVPVQVTWRLTDLADPAHELVWRLMDDSGRTVAQTTSQLAPGFVGELLEPGVFVAAEVVVPVPRQTEPGEYTLEIEDPDTGRKLTETAPEGAVQAMRLGVLDWPHDMDPPRVDTEVDAGFAGGAVRLFGYSCRLTDEGDRIDLELVWHPDQRIEENWKVFVHLRDAAGATLAQSDAIPGNWLRWSDTWLPGEYVSDRHELVLPRRQMSAESSLYVGLYDPESGVRASVSLPEAAVESGIRLSPANDAVILPLQTSPDRIENRDDQ